MTTPEKKFYEFDGFQLFPETWVLLKNGRRVRLAPKAFNVLRVLVENKGQVVTKDDLFKQVWPDAFVDENNLSVQIRKLRKDVLKDGQYIETVTGVGYKFTAEVEESKYAPAEAGEAGRGRRLRWAAALALTALLLAFAVPFVVRKIQESRVRAVVSEAGLKEFTFYKNPKSFAREQLKEFWVMPERRGLAAEKIEKGVQRLIREGQVYGQEAKPEVFQVEKISIPLYGFGDRAEVVVKEVWFMPTYDGAGNVVRPDKVHQDFGRTTYVLQKVDGRWLIYDSTASYKNDQPHP